MYKTDSSIKEKNFRCWR